MITTLRLAFVVGSLVLGIALLAYWESAAGPVFFVAYGGIGAYLAIRRPSNPIGWLLLLIGWGLALGSVQISVAANGTVATDLLRAAALWASGCGWSLAFLGVLCLSLVFPEGRLRDGRAGRFARAAIGAMAVLLLTIAFNPVVGITPVGGPFNILVPNPIAIAPDADVWEFLPAPDVFYSLMLVLVMFGIVQLLDGARRATGLARLQYRWLIAALVLIVLATVVWAVVTFIVRMNAYGPAWWLVLLAYPTVPAAIAVAVLRYRLYEIDRIISRTLSWATVTAVLVVVFAGLVVGLQALLTGVTQGQTLAVAASTLAAFALFQPVRRRVQRAVDRRFDRARYDSELTATAFAERLRTEVDLDAVAGELTGSVEHVLRPRALALWLRTPES